MATVVTVTIANATDSTRIVNAIYAVSQLQPGAVPPLYPPNQSSRNASDATVIKQYVENVLQQLVGLHETKDTGTPPTVAQLPAIT
jgi:hypothetical protein